MSRIDDPADLARVSHRLVELRESHRDLDAAIARLQADANADDGKSTVELVCGLATGLPACNPAPTLPSHTKGYVRVKLKTLDAKSNTDSITFSFGRVLGMSGATVRQQTTYAWGPPAGSSVASWKMDSIRCQRAAFIMSDATLSR